MQNIPYQQTFTLEYTPADFFYLTNSNDMPQGSEGCVNTMAGQAEICGATDPSTMTASQLQQCYKYQLCLNQTLVQEMYDKRGKHSQATTKFTDFINKYHFETYKTWNLGIGLVIILFYIYYNKA